MSNIVLTRFRNPDIGLFLSKGFKFCASCRRLVKTNEIYCSECGNKYRVKVRDKKKVR